jgi:hypothetical protein
MLSIVITTLVGVGVSFGVALVIDGLARLFLIDPYERSQTEIRALREHFSSSVPGGWTFDDGSGH